MSYNNIVELLSDLFDHMLYSLSTAKATGGSVSAPSTTVLPEPVKEVRVTRGPRDPRLSAGLAPLPRDDDSPVASTSGHVSMGGYHSNEEPLPYNHVGALKELVSLRLYFYLVYALYRIIHALSSF